MEEKKEDALPLTMDLDLELRDEEVIVYDLVEAARVESKRQTLLTRERHPVQEQL